MSLLQHFNQLPLAFGGASISGEGEGYGFGQISENQSIDLLKESYDLGIKVFDTAPIYGFGLSEVRMGKALKNVRENVFIVSKSGVDWHENRRVNMTNEPKIALKMLEESLTRLNFDYIDLYMIHWPDQKVDIRKTLEVLSKAKNAGKIKHIGLCNTYHDDLLKALEIEKIEVVQSQFNFFENKIDPSLSELFVKHDISFMSWGTLDKGILTKSVTADRKFDSSDCRSWAPWWKDQDFHQKFKIVAKLEAILEKHQMSLLEFAVHFNLSQLDLNMVICGARNSVQLNSVVKAIKKKVSKDLIQEIVHEVYQ